MRTRCSVHFWSSTEYSGFFEGLMRELQARGFEARQRFQISEASYRTVKSYFARRRLRVRQYILYPLRLILSLLLDRLRRKQADVCVVSTNTFYAPLLATCLHPNVVHLVYDLFPEAMIHSGKWRENSFKAKCLRRLTKQTFRRAKKNVFLGQRLKDYVESRYGQLPNAAVIEVGADQTLFEKPENPVSEAPKDVIQILYCGNFGNLHDTATLFRYWEKVAGNRKHDKKSLAKMPLDFRWTFLCSGPRHAELVAVRESLPDAVKDLIRIDGGLEQSEWVAAMQAADIGLVTMMLGSETVVMPSKAYSAMMAGQAILAIAPGKSDLVDMIRTVDCGWWVEPGDVAGLEQALVNISSNPKEVIKKRERARRYAHKHLGEDALAEKWKALFKEIVRTADEG